MCIYFGFIKGKVENLCALIGLIFKRYIVSSRIIFATIGTICKFVIGKHPPRSYTYKREARAHEINTADKAGYRFNV